MSSDSNVKNFRMQLIFKSNKNNTNYSLCYKKLRKSIVFSEISTPWRIFVNNKELGNLIRFFRDIINGDTQAKLAEKAELSTNYIGDIENGRKNLSLKNFCKIANALKMRPDHLLGQYYDNKLGENFMTVTLSTIKEAYHNWKELNRLMSENLGSRKVNLPEGISENIACYALNLTRNMDSTGDARDSEGNLIEIKATSNFDDDLSSFSPKTKFDRLIFVRLNLNNDQAYIYDLYLNGTEFQSLKVNKTETVGDHQRAGRRPRLSLIQYINEKNIKEITVIDLK